MRGRTARLAGAVGLVVALAGCWPAPGQGPDRRSHNPFERAITPATVASLAPAWTATLDAGGRPGPPVVSNAGIYVSDGTALYGLDAATGARRWRRTPYDSSDGLVVAPPLAEGGRVLYSWEATRFTNVGDAQWLDGATGEVVAEVGARLVDGARGTRLAGRTHVDDQRNSLTVTYLDVVDAAGATWQGMLNVEGYGGRAVLPVTLGARRAYVAGQFLDSIPVGSIPPQPLAIRAYPFAEPPVCGGNGGSLVIRCPLWSTELDAAPATSPVLGPGETTLYAVSGAGTLYALDAADGRVLWTAALGAAPSADPALADGTLFVPLADGDLAAVPAEGCGRRVCRVSWRAAVGGAAAQPAVAGGVVVVGTRSGVPQLAAVAAAGCGARRCPTLWQHPTGAAVTGAPAISGGRLYVGLADQRVVAFAPTPP